jgi:hypothetical protein
MEISNNYINISNNYILIILFIIICYSIYLTNKIRNINKENFDIVLNTSSTPATPQTVYLDITAIKNLSNMITQLNEGNYTIPNNTTVNGTFKITGPNSSVIVGSSADGISSSISDSRFGANTLCIVGQGIGPNRNIKMWDNVAIANKLATNNMDPNDLPNGWGGGLRTWDIFSSGTIGNGPNKDTLNFSVSGDSIALNNYTDKNNTTAFITTRIGPYLSIEVYNNDKDKNNTIKRPVCLNAWGGNVGIGTTTPAYALDVNGDIRFKNGSIIVGSSFDGVSSSISDSKYDANNMCIVGQGQYPNRNIHLWDNVTVDRNLTVKGSIISGGSFGAVMYDYGGSPPSYNIFGSVANYGNFLRHDVDDAYLILPGYRLIVYSESYSKIILDSDNTTGTKPIVSLPSPVNNGSSCRLYYLGNEVIIANMS